MSEMDNGFRGSAYENDQLRLLAEGGDKLLQQDDEINETNWRRKTHHLDPELTGRDMLETAETFQDPEERSTLRAWVMAYRAEISQAVQRLMEKGMIQPEQAAAKLEEIFNGPIIPEGQEIVF